MDFDTLTADQVDGLTGHQREAWYAHRNGHPEKAQAILAAYPETPEKARPESPEKPAGKPTPAERPPEAGKGSSTDAWRAYAIAQGVPEDEANELTRDELIDRLT